MFSLDVHVAETGQTAAWRWTESIRSSSIAFWPFAAYRTIDAQSATQTLSRAQKRHRECDEAPVPFPGDHRRAGGFGPGHQRHRPHCRPRRDHPRHQRPVVDFDHAENDHRLG